MNEKQSLIKLYWSEIRQTITQIDAAFSRIVDELSPDESFPVYLAYYPYGSLIADTQSSFIPSSDGRVLRLTDPAVDDDVIKHLGYGKDSLPMGMVLERQLEYFIDLKSVGITIPWLLYEPGAFFPFATIFGQNSNRTYSPNSVLMLAAGARSAFMLPNIGCVTNHINLQRDFNIQKPAPKSLYDHWHIFKEIVNSKIINVDWRCCVMYFSEKWVQKIHSDKSWLSLKSYLFEQAWQRFEYDRNRVYYDIAFSVMQQSRNLKPNPYLTDTARHLFTIALGASPGFAPAFDEKALPIYTLQKVFIESYGLKKYIPTIMQPVNYHFEEDKAPVYYSLQHPSTYAFSPKSRKISSTLFELRELEHIMNIFSAELSRENTICADTVLNKIVKTVKFGYFHNEKDRHQIIRHSEELVLLDERFNFTAASSKAADAVFAEDAKFLRGCVNITNQA